MTEHLHTQPELVSRELFDERTKSLDRKVERIANALDKDVRELRDEIHEVDKRMEVGFSRLEHLLLNGHAPKPATPSRVQKTLTWISHNKLMSLIAFCAIAGLTSMFGFEFFSNWIDSTAEVFHDAITPDLRDVHGP